MLRSELVPKSKGLLLHAPSVQRPTCACGLFPFRGSHSCGRFAGMWHSIDTDRLMWCSRLAAVYAWRWPRKEGKETFHEMREEFFLEQKLRLRG